MGDTPMPPQALRPAPAFKRMRTKSGRDTCLPIDRRCFIPGRGESYGDAPIPQAGAPPLASLLRIKARGAPRSPQEVISLRPPVPSPCERVRVRAIATHPVALGPCTALLMLSESAACHTPSHHSGRSPAMHYALCPVHSAQFVRVGVAIGGGKM